MKRKIQVNDHEIKDDFIVIYVVSLKKRHEVLIDKKDIELLKTHRFYIGKGGYVLVNERHVSKRSLEHVARVLLKAPIGMQADHINGDILDNRRKNLRLATRSQNQRNKATKGYYWSSTHKKWIAQIRANKKGKHLGVFEREEDAKKARQEAVKKYFGAFARVM